MNAKGPAITDGGLHLDGRPEGVLDSDLRPEAKLDRVVRPLKVPPHVLAPRHALDGEEAGPVTTPRRSNSESGRPGCACRGDLAEPEPRRNRAAAE
jgi:hypothetical protein